MSRNRAERYAGWVDNNRVGILVLSVLIAVLGGYLASRMPIKPDLVNLLPSSKLSVKDLIAITKRAKPFGTVQIVIESKDVALREKAGAALSAKLAKLDTTRPDLITDFSPDDGPLDRYAWANRFLLAPLDDLIAARDGLQKRIDKAKLGATGLYIDLDDDDDPDEAKLADVEQRLADLETKAKSPPPRVSADGTLQLLVVQTAFAPSEPHRAKTLIGLIQGAIDETKREVGPGVTVGLAGNITFALHEHDSVLEGMAMSGAITVILCAFALLLYYRSGKIVLGMLWSLGVGVAAAFALAWAVIGHLNIMTAFLTAIVVGNGINAGLLLVARYLEEVRAGVEPRAAIAPAIAGSIHGTLAATATAAVSYTSLLITDFRGFRQFGGIAGTGMLLTWIATYTVLPAVLLVLARRGMIKKSTKPPAMGTVLAKLMPRSRRGLVITMVVGGALVAGAAVVTAHYIAGDPFTHDWRDLQSSTPAIRAAQVLDQKIKTAFDPKSMLSGQAFQVVVGVDHRDQVRSVVEMLRKVDADRPADKKWIYDVRSIEDLIPADQDKKIDVLKEIQKKIDDPKLQDSLDDDEQAKLARLRPTDEQLVPIADASVPHELAWPFIEKDASIGRLIIVRGSKRFKSFNVDDRLEFAGEVRRLQLPHGAVVAGEALVVADIIKSMEDDAPNMVAFALAGSLLAVFFVIGLRRHGMVTLGCGLAGVVVMIAACAIAGLKVHFLDLIALPITIGIGIDYAVNLAARDRQDGQRGPHHLLRTTGGAVLLASYTTTVGYGTLMLSANGGIRAFGEAALIGELSCITMALIVAPAWLTLLRRRDVKRENPAASGLPT